MFRRETPSMNDWSEKLIEVTRDAVYRYALDDGEILFCNRGFATLLGVDGGPEELQGKRLLDVMIAVDPDERFKDSLVRRGEVRGWELRLRTVAGDERWVECDAVLGWEGDSGRRVVTCIARDITSRKATETLLQESETKLAGLMSFSPSFQIVQREGRILLASPKTEAVLGYSRDQLYSGSFDFFRLFAADAMTRIRAALSKQSRGARIDPEPYTLLRSDGQSLIVRVAMAPVTHAGERAVLVIGTDLTGQTEQADKLRESEDRFRRIFDSNLVGMAVMGLDYRFLKVNGTLCRLLDQPEAELASQTLLDITHPADCAKDVRGSQPVFSGLAPSFSTQTRYIRRNKEVLWGNLTLSVIRDSDERPLHALLMIEDITERRTTERSLRDSEERYRKLVESMREGMWVSNELGVFTYVNHRFCEMLGFSRDEVVGRPATAFLDRTNQKTFLQELERQSRRDAVNYELVWSRKDGGQIPTIVSPFVFREGRGRFAGSFAVITDITERKEEEERTKASLREKELMLMEIHHRVKNNLQVISSLLKLQSSAIENRQVRDMFKTSHNRIRTMALIHEKLYQSKDLARVDFGAYVRSLTTHLFASYAEIAPHVKLAVDISGVFLDINTAIPCGLIINELTSNALKHAFPPGRAGQIDVRIRRRDNLYELTVADTGIGLPPGVDFTRTESLGLQLVNTLARQLEGTIGVDRNGGTRFVLTFPELKYRSGGRWDGGPESDGTGWSAAPQDGEMEHARPLRQAR